MLRDFCPQPEHKGRINLLVSAVKQSVTVYLLESTADIPTEITLSRLTKRMQDTHLCDEHHARWAVESWAVALGVVTAADLRKEQPSTTPAVENVTWVTRRTARGEQYDKALAGSDQALLQLFTEIHVDANGRRLLVPVVFGSLEDAVKWILYEGLQVRDTIRLPLVNLWSTDCEDNRERYREYRIAKKGNHSAVSGPSPTMAVDVRYTLWAWAKSAADVEQMLRQIWQRLGGAAMPDWVSLSRRSVLPFTSIQETGASWSTLLKVRTITDNLDVDPGDKSIRVYKYQFEMVAETFVCDRAADGSPDKNHVHFGQPQQATVNNSATESASSQQDSAQSGTEIESGLVRHKCPACGKRLKTGATAAGQRVRCFNCRTLLEVSADHRVLTLVAHIIHHDLASCPVCSGVLLPSEGAAHQRCVHCGWPARQKCPACGRVIKVGAKTAGCVLPCPACEEFLLVSENLISLAVASDSDIKSRLTT